MSVSVPIEALQERIAEFGAGAFLITASVDGRVHVVSTSPHLDNAVVVATAGRTTRANVAANPSVTLLWPESPDGAYSLIVDGLATAGSGDDDDDDDDVVVTPTKAVLHRLPNVAGERPRCLPVERRRD